MSNASVIACKSCGAKLTVGDEPQIVCSYCGTPNIVPEELRPRKPAATAAGPQVIVVQANPETVRRAAAVTTTVAAGTGVLGCILPLVITAVVLVAVAGALLPLLSVPEIAGPLQGVIPGANSGFARRVAVFGDEGTGLGFFQDARHVAVDGAGTVYVSDLNTQRIQRFDKDGKATGFWTIEEKGVSKLGPSRLAADRNGTVYALWERNVLKYDGASGKLLGKISGEIVNRAANLTEDIHDIALSPAGQLWAITGFAASDDLVRFDGEGKVAARIKKAVSTPKDESVFASSLRLAVDGLGNVFVADTFPSKPAIYKFNAEGKYVNKFGGRGDQPGQFTSAPGIIAVDAKSRVFAADFGRIHVFDGDGRFIDLVPGTAFDHTAYDLAFSGTDLYVVGRNKVYKLAVTESAGK